jgi:hypothetical protein
MTLLRMQKLLRYAKHVKSSDLFNWKVVKFILPASHALCAWARYTGPRPQKVYYASTRADAAGIGFDDAFIYKEISLPVDARKIAMTCVHSDEAIRMFEEWQAMKHKNLY